ncbi:MAG: DUF1080 domain-containing protein [Planctomycetales bacterium]|nr:DUF1080 domain-containing protein [Planctomycetales bacterium]
MTRFRRFAPFAVLFASLVFVRCAAADDNDQELFTDPAKAGADYETQGEYLGSLQQRDELALGMQVIALGDGKFDVVVYKNGLPGAGWSRGEDTIKGAVQRGDDGVVRGEIKGKQVKIADGEVTVTDGAEVYAKLKKADRKSPTLGAKPPEGATVLFDGSSAEHFNNGKIVQERLLLADCDSKQKLGDHTLHLEFRTPFKPKARGQARGNSGMYLQSRYEVQVLDSFGLDGKNNECGGIYSIAEPAVNMCLPPLVWQTYDVEFTAAKYENGKKIANARTTIKHNGVVIHDDLELPNGTPGRQAEGPEPAPLYLQGHGNPVVYRNIWVVTN